jgi:hypothetical protein
VIRLGSAVTGLMVWRDVDYGVDAAGAGAVEAWSAMRPLLETDRCVALRYENETGARNRWSPEDARHYFVARIEAESGAEWKVDASIWVAGVPPCVEPFQASLLEGLTPEFRLATLRLKEAWHRQPVYPEIVSAFEIYEAVLHHGVRTVEELDAWLVARGLPVLGSEGPDPAV